MKFITTDLQKKIEDGTATDNERVVYEILRALGELTPEEAVQKVLQADAVLDARDQGRPDIADVLLQLFVDDEATVRRGENGYEFRLTDEGIARAAHLVHEAARKTLN